MTTVNEPIRANPLTGTQTKTIETPYSKDGWKIVRCVETGMVFLENPPAYEDLSEDFAWEKTYAEEKERRRNEEPLWSKLSSAGKGLRRIVRPQQRMITESLKAINELRLNDQEARPVRLVDVGCGDGKMSLAIAQELKSTGSKIALQPIGVEVSLALSKITQQQLEPLGGYCITNNAIDGLASLESSSADIVILCSFLEHEVNPLTLLQEVDRVLSQEGVCIIKVPNYASINRLIRQKRWCGFRYPDHVNYFTPKTLRAIILESGLTVKRMGFLDTLPTGDNMWAIAGKR